MSGAVLVVAVGLSVWYHLGLPGQVGAFALSLPGLVLAWIAYQAAYAVPTLTEAIDQLASAVQAQWKTELHVRWLDGPVQLLVSWSPAPAGVTAGWPENSRKEWPLAGVGSREHRLRAGRLRRLARHGHDLDELRRLAEARLVVLGAPGSGKTVLLMRLVLKLIEHRRAGDPVPILVPLASWDPSNQSLRSWLLARLTVDHPGLNRPAPAQYGKVNLAQVMFDKHLFALVLDGLDEIAPEARKAALEQINIYARPGEGLVLSCRTEQYLHAARSEVLQFRQLGGTAIVLSPLTPADVARYLQGFPAGAPADRWDLVLRELRTNPVLAEVLSTPLMVDLAHIVYNLGSFKADRLAHRTDPTELCDSGRFATSAEMRAHLFDAFIDASYRPHGDAGAGRWSAADAKRWLAFLAHHLESDMGGTADLAWWMLRSSAPRSLVPLVTGLICGAAAGLAAGLGRHAGLGIGLGLGAGMISGLAIGLVIRRLTGFAKRSTGPLRGIAGGLVGALIGAVAAGVAGEFGLGQALGPFGGLDVALGVGVGVGSATSFPGGVAGGLVGGFVGALARGVAEGVPAGLVNGLGAGLAAAFAVALVARKTPASNLRWSPVGLLGGLVIGAAVGLITTSVEGPVAGALLGISIGTLSSWPCGLTGLKADLSKAASPRGVFTYDRRTFFKTAFAAGMPAGIAGFVGGGLTSVFEVKTHADPAVLMGDGLGIGLASALIIGLAFGFYHAAYGPFLIDHLWLVLRGRIPWHLMPFLADAHEKRGILRESGAFYQFRHIDLQRQLARGYSVDSATWSGSSIKLPGHMRASRALSLVGLPIGIVALVLVGTLAVSSRPGRHLRRPLISAAPSWTYVTHAPVDGSAAVAGGLAYIADDDGVVYALDARTGRVRWTRDTYSQIDSRPFVYEGAVYIGNDASKFYALDAFTGRIRWVRAFSGGIDSSPTVRAGIVYFGDGNNALRALKASNGDSIWTRMTNGTINSSPAVENGVLYVGSDDGKVYAWNARTGTRIWDTYLAGNIDSSPAVARGVVYVGSDNHDIYALRATTGKILWALRTGGPVYSSPFVCHRIVYVGSNDHKLYAVDASTGQQVWDWRTRGAIYASPIVYQGIVYAGSDDGALYAFQATTGRIVSTRQTGGNVQSGPAAANNVIYVGSDNNEVLAIPASRSPGRTGCA